MIKPRLLQKDLYAAGWTIAGSREYYPAGFSMGWRVLATANAGPGKTSRSKWRKP